MKPCIEQVSIGSGHASSELNETVGLIVAAASWDERSMAVTRFDSAGRKVILLRYANRGRGSRSASHYEAIKDWAAPSAETTEVPFSSEDIASSSLLTVNTIDQAIGSLDPRSRVLIDLSTTPRYLSLLALAHLLRTHKERSISFICETASYEPRRRPARSHFSVGNWRVLEIPGYHHAGRRSDRWYTVGLGFDGEDTYRTVKRMKPAGVSAIVADPPSSAGLVERCLEENEALLREWVAQSDLYRCGAADAVGVAATLGATPDDARPHVFFPVGTKPHALGMAVAALGRTRTSLAYRWPDSHSENIQSTTGEGFVYTVRMREG
jgi:hypothetical protein